MGDDYGEVISCSKSNIPLVDPSETCSSEELLARDVRGGETFGLIGWGAETFYGGEMGAICNCGGDDGGGINDCSKIETKTIRVFVTDVTIV